MLTNQRRLQGVIIEPSATPRALPHQLLDFIPTGPGPIVPLRTTCAVPAPSSASTSYITPTTSIQDVVAAPSRVHKPIITATNVFGLFRRYIRPSQPDPIIPDTHTPLEERAYRPSSPPTADDSNAEVNQLIKRIIRPFPNLSSFMISHWFWNTGWRKTAADRCRLVKEVLLSPWFVLKDLHNIDFAVLDKELDIWGTTDTVADDLFSASRSNNDKWITSSVTIQVPTGKIPKSKVSKSSNAGLAIGSQSFTVPGLRHRKLVEVIKSSFNSDNARRFHYEPYEEYWQPPDLSKAPVRVFNELYCSRAWNEEHQQLQNGPVENGCSLPRVIAAIMLWSDSTQLSQFGHSSLWPIYYFPGNLSKYERAAPRARSGIHIAYIPKVSNNNSFKPC
jgi:hypothetical protein